MFEVVLEIRGYSYKENLCELHGCNLASDCCIERYFLKLC